MNQLLKLARLAKGTPLAGLVIVLVIVASLVSGCALDQEKLERTRSDLVVLCQNPVTAALRAVCERHGLMPGGLTESEPIE